MAAIAEQIATYLDAQNIADYSATTASGIYIDILPEKSDVFAIYNRPGQYSESNLGYKKVGIQIIYKGTGNPITSFAKAESCFDKLKGFAGLFVTGGNYVVGCLTNQDGAAAIGQDKNGNFEYSMNFVVEYKT